ncbi:MAG: carbohydrate kinase [Bacillota bacterium]
MFNVVALGETLIDFASIEVDAAGYPTMKANPGGAPANFLATLNKYGDTVAFIGKVGADTFGNLLIETLESAGIDTRGVVRDPNFFTTLAFVTFDEEGDRTFAFARKPGADTQLAFDEVDTTVIDLSQILHFGTLSLTDNPVRRTTQKAVEYAKEKGKWISFDPNLRIPLWDDLEEAKKQMLWGISQTDFLKISDEEVIFLWECTPEEGVEKILQEYAVSLVLLTEGEKGCTAFTRTAIGKATCPEVKPIDTTGAGDICGGSAMSCILDTGKNFSELTAEELQSIAEFATTAASLSTEHSGGIPSIPDKEVVLKKIAEKNEK